MRGCDQDADVLGDPDPPMTDVMDDIDAASARHVDIDDHEIGFRLLDRAVGLARIAAGRDLRHPHDAEQPAHQDCRKLVVVDNDDAKLAEVEQRHVVRVDPALRRCGDVSWIFARMQTRMCHALYPRIARAPPARVPRFRQSVLNSGGLRVKYRLKK